MMGRTLLWQSTGGTAIAPAYPGDVGVDLATTERVLLQEGHIQYVPLGVRFAPPDDCWLLLVGRSSTARRLGLACVPGIIDPGYRGEMYAGVYPVGSQPPQVVPAGTVLAQAILIPAVQPRLVQSEQLPESERGENGFGSSDMRRDRHQTKAEAQPSLLDEWTKGFTK